MNAERKSALNTLTLLVDRYPNLRVGQIISNATDAFDPYHISDADLARGLNQLLVSYTQLAAAGIKL